VLLTSILDAYNSNPITPVNNDLNTPATPTTMSSSDYPLNDHDLIYEISNATGLTVARVREYYTNGIAKTNVKTRRKRAANRPATALSTDKEATTVTRKQKKPLSERQRRVMKAHGINRPIYTNSISADGISSATAITIGSDGERLLVDDGFLQETPQALKRRPRYTYTPEFDNLLILVYAIVHATRMATHKKISWPPIIKYTQTTKKPSVVKNRVATLRCNTDNDKRVKALEGMWIEIMRDDEKKYGSFFIGFSKSLESKDTDLSEAVDLLRRKEAHQNRDYNLNGWTQRIGHVGGCEDEECDGCEDDSMGALLAPLMSLDEYKDMGIELVVADEDVEYTHHSISPSTPSSLLPQRIEELIIVIKVTIILNS